MAYSAKFTRNDDGSYQGSYGKGGKKLTARLWLNDAAGGWQVDATDPSADVVNKDAPYSTLRSCKQAWGEWAASQYDGNGGPERPAPGSPTSPPPLVKKGPPSFKRPGPPSHKPAATSGPPSHKPTTPKETTAADPFDPRFRGPGPDHHLTPLGLAVEVRDWLAKHRPHCDLLVDVNACLRRECPDIFKDQA